MIVYSFNASTMATVMQKIKDIEDEKKLDSGEEDKEKRKKKNPSIFDGEDPVRSCKFCNEKSGKECSMLNDLSPHATPLISPTISVSSTDSFFSSYSEFLFEANLHGREE